MKTPLTAAGKVVFADQLRGLAAILVVINHFVSVYWYAPDIVAQYIFAPVQSAPVPAVASIITHVPFNPGAVGVSLFFVISGFVIPFSFRHHTGASFLLARLLRIYPTYLVALTVGVVARYVSARYWGHHFDIRPSTFIVNALLIQDLVSVPSMDLVNWTLTIELKFYLMFALSHSLLPRWRAWYVLAVGAAAIAINLTAVALIPHLSVRYQGVAASLGNEAMCAAFMLLGTLFFMRLQGLLSIGGLFVSSIVGLALFQACWATGTMSAQFPLISNNYLYGWAIFALCFLARAWFVPTALLRQLAEISYPLYLVHSMVGYALMTLLITGLGLGYGSAISIAVATAIASAYAINRLVERRSIAMGRSVGRMMASNARASESAQAGYLLSPPGD